MDQTVLANHPIQATLAQLKAAAEWPEIQSVLPSSALDRVFQFAELVRTRLDSTPATLTSNHGLNALNGVLTQVLAELTSYRANPNISLLDSAANLIDTTGFPNLFAIPVVAPLGGSEGLGQIADSFFDRSNSLMQKLVGDNSRLTEMNQKLADQISTQSGQIGALVETVAAQKIEAQATNAEVKRDYAIVEQDLRSKFQSLLDKQVTDAAALVKAQTERFDATKNEFAATGEKLVKQMSEKRDEAGRLVQIVGNITITGNYQRIAKLEGEQANLWRWITFAVFAAAATYGAVTLWELKTVDWQIALVRGVFALVIASVGFYTARESAHHRTIADDARRIELELASLGPFIETLPQANREGIREKLIDHYFGGQTSAHTIEPLISAKDGIGLLEKAVTGSLALAKDAIRRG